MFYMVWVRSGYNPPDINQFQSPNEKGFNLQKILNTPNIRFYVISNNYNIYLRPYETNSKKVFVFVCVYPERSHKRQGQSIHKNPLL